MSFTGVMEKLTGALKQRRSTLQEQYDRITHQLADGKLPGAEQVEEVLAALGKSAENLGADAKLVVDRRRWREEVQAGAAA